MIYLVVRSTGTIGLSEKPCPWSFEIPHSVDRYQVLREARDERSALHRLLALQVALIAEVQDADRPTSGESRDGKQSLESKMLALGQRKIDEAMRQIDRAGYDAASGAVLQASLRPLTIEITDWTLVRVRANGKQHAIGFRAGTCRGRSSSPIQHFDPLIRTATTQSGNRYALIGDPSEAGFDDLLVRWWLACHDLDRHDVVIINEEDL